MSMYGKFADESKWEKVPGRPKVYPVVDCSVMPSKTKQEFAIDCDVNRIMKQFEKNGVLPEFLGEPFYGDVSEVADFQTAMNTVILGRQLFEQFPGYVRARFQNDPALMIEFLADPKNREEAISLGLIAKAPEVPPVATPPGGSGVTPTEVK